MEDTLNQWVTDKLNAHKMSMSSLEKLANIPRGYISKVLSGKRNAGMDFYFKIAKAFNAIPEMLQVANILSPADEKEITFMELFRAIRSLSPEERRHLEEYVDFLVAKEKKRRDTAKTRASSSAADRA